MLADRRGSRPEAAGTRVYLGLIFIAIASSAAVARQRITQALASGGDAETQRPLAGGTGGENPPVDRPVRVVLLDGLSRADAPRLPALEALCARGAQLVVDIGFPSKSLPVQRVLWSGLTAQQQGDRADNRSRPPPSSSLPLLVPGLIAVAESHAEIALDVGFAQVETPPPERFASAAAAAVASPAPLVLVHVLAIDTAAHRHGRRGAAYADALAFADTALAASVAAAPDAQWLVLADHGHVAAGGHGDVEDEVRRVRACWAPAPADLPRDAEVHLIDVARWLADALVAPRHPRAAGRTLAIAAAHPDRDATLPRAGVIRSLVATLLALASLAAGVLLTRRRWTALWPVATAAALLAFHGIPTLSHRPSGFLVVAVAMTPAVIAALLERRRPWAVLAPAGGCVAALAVLSRIPEALVGAAPHVPWWTGLLGAAATALAAAMAAVGAVLVATARSRE